MNGRKAILCIVALVFFSTTIGSLVFADPTAPQSLNVVDSTTRDLGTLAAQTVGAQGGNVTEVNINALTITTSWQGYFGQVSGEITLDDGANNTFYNWSMTTVSGEVYATRSSTVTWDEIVCANVTHFGQEETYLGQTSSDGDSVSNTFNLQSHPAFSVGTRDFIANECNSTNAFSSNATQSVNWTQILLHQNDTTAANIIYATIINDTTIGFDGGTYDFQLLVGENEKTGNIGATTYYFWVELT